MGLRALRWILLHLRHDVDAIEQIVERSLLDDDARRVALRLRQAKGPPVKPLVTHARMQALPAQGRALCV